MAKKEYEEMSFDYRAKCRPNDMDEKEGRYYAFASVNGPQFSIKVIEDFRVV